MGASKGILNRTTRGDRRSMRAKVILALGRVDVIVMMIAVMIGVTVLGC